MSGNEKDTDVDETLSVKSDKDQPQLKEEALTDPDENKDDMHNDENDDFGDFDDGSEFGDFDVNNAFGDFEDNDVVDDNTGVEDSTYENEELPVQDNPMTLDEILELWSGLMKTIYPFQPVDSFTTNNSTKSIKFYVLEEAPDSFHSRITWDSVTKYMDDDNGIPRVRWVNSDVEKLHLKALACQRSEAPISTAPTMLNISHIDHAEGGTTSPLSGGIATNSITREPETMKSPTKMNSVESTGGIPVTGVKSPISPTSEKRSSIFGLSSLSRYLPHLSKSKLPSPTSPSFNTSAPTTPRIVVPNHNIVTSEPNNYMNVQQPAKNVSSNLKRANTVAFSSSSNPTTKHRMRPVSSQSMDLLDLFDEDITKASNPYPMNFTPLVPTASTSTPQQGRRYTIPANIHSDVKPSIPTMSTVIDEEEDDFGDFTGEDGDMANNLSAFDVFSTSMVRSKTEPTKDGSKNDDPYDKASYFQTSSPGYNSVVTKNTVSQTSSLSGSINSYNPQTVSRKPTTPSVFSSKAVDNDPYDRASYFVHTQPKNNIPTNNNIDDPLGLFSEPNPQTIAQPTIPSASAQFDLLSPVYNQQPTKKATSAKQELFDSFMTPSSTNNETKPTDDEDWGDWAI